MAFPTDPLGIVVEAFVDDDWLDITRLDDDTHVLGLDGTTGVSINGGRSSQAGRPSATQVTFDYLDNNATLDGDNPLSPYWRKIGEGTPIRVSADSDVRAVVELVSAEPDTDETGNRTVLAVEAAGIMRRLGGSRARVAAPLTSSVLSGSPIAWWPLTDGSDATQAGSGLPGGTPMTLTSDSLSFAAAEGPAGVQGDAPELLSGTEYTGGLYAPVVMASTDGWTVEGWMRFTSDDTSGEATAWHWRTTGTYGSRGWNVLAARDSDLDGISMTASHASSSTLFSYNSVPLQGEWRHVRVTATQDDATTVSIRFYIDGVLRDFDLANPSDTVGRITDVWVADTGDRWGEPNGIDSLAVSGLAIYDQVVSSTDNYDAGTGYAGELAGDRMDRLSTEAGVSLVMVGDAAETAACGPQPDGSYLDVMFDAAKVDGGILGEQRTALGLRYRTRRDLYNQTPTVQLSYADPETLVKPFRPVRDDLNRTNDVTLSRPAGATARYAIPDGDWYHLSTEEPPAGGNLRDTQDELGVATDDQLDDHAAWWAHLGSWREKRFASVSVELARPDVGATLRAQVRAALPGDLIKVDTEGAPRHIPQDEVRLMAQGYRETLAQFKHTFVFNTTPADPYEVTQVETGGSTIANVIDDNDTSVKLTTALGPAWLTGAPLARPYYIAVDGDAMKVTTLTTDTPAFIAAGAASHAVNANVTPGLPAGMTPDVGQLMLLWAAIRNSGTGTVNTPTGWTTLVDFANVRLMYRYYVTGVTGPTVTFSGGVAGADTSAQIATFSGLSHEFASGTKAVPAAATVLNSSAANITTPAVTVRRDGGVKLWIGWRQQDWTSVATLAAADAEIGEPDTATGDNQGLVWDYDIYTTAADIAADAFVVTGGVNGISRGITLALRPLQTATVERGINNAATSHTPGAEVHGWRMGVNAL